MAGCWPQAASRGASCARTARQRPRPPAEGPADDATSSPDLGTPRRYAFRTPARALVRSWAPGQQVHGESPRLVGWVDYTIEHVFGLSLIHISEPTRLGMISYAVFCL